MSENVAFTPGTPCWVDLGSPDVGAAKDFYAELFGWDFAAVPGRGDHAVARLRGEPVAGVGPATDDGPRWWTTYVAVRDADLTAKLAVEAGGGLTAGPLEIADHGRSAFLTDPAGAALAVWQAGGFPGAAITGVPGTLCWSELAVRDTRRAAAFYGRLFGWRGRGRPFAGGSSTYTDFETDGGAVAGMVEMNEAWPAEIPAHWMAYFAVGDCDASCAKVAGLGGVVSVPPFDIGAGRVAVVDDPCGAVFSIIARA
ncbi:VOC family protein [Planotetraspora kaengkrachanensis]|uniref:Hydroxylase n=1 Tax=Planotetraspora kaengkrachanensis TaxID=575193 RepID=A0A8J3PTP0_9ACTN|nr:VOC family protein [Planotetraspora kaengkrachanensis]GIG80546.1 hydroxylase [Planotetraspora kaengkrachanensis]